ncbi:hypothetical protein pdam_00019216 [Pocillopora damicornis]|uniref:Endonuclease n=1 Tax=Pocillopora damicornis TaxID=46731 RepID=A0A3M6UF67_POCDA|nr:hypothetical protein pdam_00019216 [Pocillopora damicornis]
MGEGKRELIAELEDDERKYKVKVDGGSSEKKYFGLSKRRLALVAGAILVILLIIILLVVFLVKVRSKKSKVSKSPIGGQEECSSDPLIIISMDGFRPDFLGRNLTPNIDYLASNGVRAKFLLPQFPTKTFPNHYSMITGLFPSHTGIVANNFRDEKLNDNFRIGGPTTSDPKWWKGEPLWVTAIKQGLVSTCYFWVGRPSFITLYFHQPDYIEHRAGPNSEKTNAQYKRVDDMIGRLWKGLKDRSMQDKVNMVLVGDHGIAPKSCQRIVYTDAYNVTLDDVYSPQWYGGAFITMNPKPGVSAEEIVARLQCKNPHFRVFLKENLPKRLHYSDNRRIGRIILIPEDGWLVGFNSTSGIWFCDGGDHGYDNIDPNMRTLFVAHGPAFKKGEVVDHFLSTELYGMMADILGLKPAPNDGTPGSLRHLLDPSVDIDVLETESDGKLMRTDICRKPAGFDNCSQCICKFCDKRAEVILSDKKLDMSDQEISEFQATHLPWGVPEGGAGREGCILAQKGFVTGYSTSLRLPLWVAYRLDGEKASQSGTRRDCFRKDTRLTDSQASLCKHYKYSGVDRGHMAPNGDFDSSNENDEAWMDTYLLSNIAPQYHGFNAGIWLKAEDMVRDLAANYSHVYVISGSIFDENADGLRDEDESITSKKPYYKVPGCEGRLDVISFVLPHLPKLPCFKYESSSKYLLENTARVRDIELLTGIKFFSGLPPAEQARLKTISPVKLWP